jgi:hypothetical protein
MTCVQNLDMKRLIAFFLPETRKAPIHGAGALSLSYDSILSNGLKLKQRFILIIISSGMSEWRECGWVWGLDRFGGGTVGGRQLSWWNPVESMGRAFSALTRRHAGRRRDGGLKKAFNSSKSSGQSLCDSCQVLAITGTEKELGYWGMFLRAWLSYCSIFS